MVDKENPPSNPSADSSSPVDAILVSDAGFRNTPKNELDTVGRPGDPPPLEPVTAQLVDASPADNVAPMVQTVPLPVENLAAKGGAVASVVLGAWSIAGAFITPYSAISALLGLALGFLGMSSSVRWPWKGPVLCLIGLAFCLLMGSE